MRIKVNFWKIFVTKKEYSRSALVGDEDHFSYFLRSMMEFYDIYRRMIYPTCSRSNEDK